jgi:glyoxylase-like metal-dependent hydrolase (beta-lactamase superfamily II)
MVRRVPVLAISSLLAMFSLGDLTFASTAGQPPQVVRTGDPYKRGHTDADFPRVRRLAEGAYSYEQLRSAGTEKFTTVSFFVVTTAGVLVADGQGSVVETQRLVDEIARITPRPITHVVIGSDHGDHTGGNRAFPAGVNYFVHPTSQAILSIPGAELVPDRATIRLGETEIQVRFLGRAHTGGDLSVYLPKQKILFMSEAFLNRIFPAMRSAYPSEWVAAIEKAQAMDVDVYVPGHGFVDSPAILKEELETFRRAIVQVIAEARRLRAAGLDADTAAAQAKFGDLEGWTLRESQGATAIRRVFLELEGKLGGGGTRRRFPARYRGGSTFCPKRIAARSWFTVAGAGDTTLRNQMNTAWSSGNRLM